MAQFIYHQFAPGTPEYIFVGWDSLDSEATEATEARHLGKPMPHVWKRTFRDMDPGERRRLPSGSFLFRE